MRKFSGARGAKLSSVGLAVAVALALGLTGCAPRPSPNSPTPHASVAPVFKTDAEALAAAKKAYEGYLAVSDAIGNDGGKDAERIAPWVTSKWLPKELNSYASLAKSGKRLTGASSYSKFTLQQIEQPSNGRVSLAIYLCDDISQSRVVDGSGEDVTPPSRHDVVPIEVRFANERANASKLLIDGSERWSGTDFCS